ncbi:hypothetical protein AKJ16_DCAP04711 [Drosera capensis]
MLSLKRNGVSLRRMRSLMTMGTSKRMAQWSQKIPRRRRRRINQPRKLRKVRINPMMQISLMGKTSLLELKKRKRHPLSM